MKRHSFLPAILLVVFSFTSPVSATLYLSTPDLSPPSVPLTPGENLAVNATLTLIPAGPTTFEPANDLQMTTGLIEPAWNAQVMVNRRAAARIPARGGALFINGFLLSYPTSSSVSVDIQLQGIVPPAAGDSVALLSIVQISNTGSAVPGSTITVTEPVSAPVSPATSDIRTATPETMPPSPTPGTPAVTRSSGFGLGLVLFTLLILGVLVPAGRERRG